MGIISDMAGASHSIMAEAQGSPVVEYYNGTSWIVIANAVWHERQGFQEQDDDRARQTLLHSAILTYPLSGPDMPINTKVRVSSGPSFAVIGINALSNLHSYQLEYREVVKNTFARGAI
jgi:hypothetical protein